jgi:hypothetical protein
MPGVARACAPFLLGFDVLEPVTEPMLQAATARGFQWIGRYLETLKPAERDLIFRYGFGIAPLLEAMTVQVLTAATGSARGELADAQASAIGTPLGVHVTIDLELPRAGSDVLGHVDALADRILSGRRGAALYVGVPQPLDGANLFAARPNRYWRGAGDVPEPACGWAALQLEPLEGVVLAGTKVDVDVSQADRFSRVLTMWWPQ